MFWLLHHPPRKRAPFSTCSTLCPRNWLDKRDVFIDCGRLGAAPIADEAFERSEMALLLVRPVLPDLHCVVAWLEARTEVGSSLGLVLVGDGPYNKTDVDHALHVEVLGDVPLDPDGVSALISASSRRRSPLLDTRGPSLPDPRALHDERTGGAVGSG